MNALTTKKSILNTVTFIASGVCNLNCKYCFIPKVKELKNIHSKVIDQFNQFKILDFFLKDYPYAPKTITEVQLWGGEPTAGLKVINDNISYLFEKLPNINSLFFSSNFTLDANFEQVLRLIDILGKKASTEQKQFELSLQMSIDGPTELNDYNRGLGTTHAIIRHFNELINYNYDNSYLTIKISLKQTLSRAQLDDLCDYDYCYNYVKFFSDNFYLPYSKSLKKCDFYMGCPNFATPGHYTSDDGKKFAKAIANFLSVAKANLPGTSGYAFVPFYYLVSKQAKIDFNNNTHFAPMQRGFCGLNTESVVLLPNGRYSLCHRYFSPVPKEFIDTNYDKTINYEVDFEQESRVNQILMHMRETPNRLEAASAYALIKVLAGCGQILTKYSDPKEADKVIRMLNSLPNCLMVNAQCNGTYTLGNKDDIRLFLNGAIDELFKCKEYFENLHKKGNN